MPRPRKAPRVTYIPSEDEWRIFDSGPKARTGVRGPGNADAAGEALKNYLNRPVAIPIVPNGPVVTVAAPMGLRADQILIGQILQLYVAAKINDIVGRAVLLDKIKALGPFWAGKTLAEVTSANCREYQKLRAKPRKNSQGQKMSAGRDTIRRDLGVLQAAINFALKEGTIIEKREVTLPKPGRPLDRWLTTTEAAWLLWAAELHVRRFIVTCLDTGRRKEAVSTLKWKKTPGGGYADVRIGVIDFEDYAVDPNDKQRRQCAMTPRLWSHMRRWRRLSASGPIEFPKRGCAPNPKRNDIKSAFERACRRAEEMHAAWLLRTGHDDEPLDLSDVTPHTLKHTSITWFFQAGGFMTDAEDFFATSSRTLVRVYKQHSPSKQGRAVAALNLRGRFEMVRNPSKPT